MKRLFLNLLCLLFAYPCFAAEPIQLARMSPWVAGSVAAVASKSCATDSTVLFDSLSNSKDSFLTAGASSGNYWSGQKGVQFSAETVICKVTYSLRSLAGDTPPTDAYSEITVLSGTSWGTFSPAACRSAAYNYNGTAENHPFDHGDTCVVPANTNIGFALTALKDTGVPYPTAWTSFNMTPSTAPSVVGNAADWGTDKSLSDNYATQLTIIKIEGYAK